MFTIIYFYILYTLSYYCVHTIDSVVLHHTVYCTVYHIYDTYLTMLVYTTIEGIDRVIIMLLIYGGFDIRICEFHGFHLPPPPGITLVDMVIACCYIMYIIATINEYFIRVYE